MKQIIWPAAFLIFAIVAIVLVGRHNSADAPASTDASLRAMETPAEKQDPSGTSIVFPSGIPMTGYAKFTRVRTSEITSGRFTLEPKKILWTHVTHGDRSYPDVTVTLEGGVFRQDVDPEYLHLSKIIPMAMRLANGRSVSSRTSMSWFNETLAPEKIEAKDDGSWVCLWSNGASALEVKGVQGNFQWVVATSPAEVLEIGFTVTNAGTVAP